jgi:hypothetical protein
MKVKKILYGWNLLTKSHNIFPIDICSPSVFKPVINSLDQIDVYTDL